MGRKPTPLSAKERDRIADAIAAGVPLRRLHESGRFPRVSEKTMRDIANSRGIARPRHVRRAEAAKAVARKSESPAHR
jgi:hypothetical protein